MLIDGGFKKAKVASLLLVALFANHSSCNFFVVRDEIASGFPLFCDPLSFAVRLLRPEVYCFERQRAFRWW